MKIHHILLATALLALTSCNNVNSSQETTKSTTYDTLIRSDDDTTQQIITSHLEDGNVVSRDTSAPLPITQFLWFVNHYQDTVVLEVWTGTDLEWRNGTVLGHGLTALPDQNARSTPLAPNARRRISPRQQTELLAIVGLPDKTTASAPNLLSSRRFLDVSPGDTIVLDTQGLLQLH